MSGFRADRAEKKNRSRIRYFARGYARGFNDGHMDAKENLKEIIIMRLNNDAVVQMTATTDALIRIVEIIEEL